jgi:hypothetical protein
MQTRLPLAGLLAAGWLAAIASATPYAFTGNYAQSFDTLASQTLSSTVGTQTALTNLAEWQVAKSSGTGTTAMPFNVDSGSITAGGIYSYGTAASSDRALGSLASGSNVPVFGASFTNNSGTALAGIHLEFTSEFWRSSTSTQNRLAFAFGTSATDALASTFLTSAALSLSTALDVVGPVAVASNGALDGNSPTNQGQVAGDIAFDWQPGTTLYLRWADTNDLGNDAGLAIDSFRLTAIPEPSTYAVVLGGLTLGLSALRRRRV